MRLRTELPFVQMELRSIENYQSLVNTKRATETARSVFFECTGRKSVNDTLNVLNIEAIMKNGKRSISPEKNRNLMVQRASSGSLSRIWLYGHHTVMAALANRNRKTYRLVMTQNSLSQLPNEIQPEILDNTEIERLLPPGAVHQGLALLTSPLPAVLLDDILGQTSNQSVIVVLDQVNDPRNVGAVLRSAAAFGSDAVIAPDRHTPEATAVLAKAASGALEKIPFIRVTNLARTLDQLKDAGYWCAGFTADADQTLAQAKLSGKIVMVFGEEGRGMRRLTRAKCDYLVRISIDQEMDSLNLSAAAAISLYELKRN